MDSLTAMDITRTSTFAQVGRQLTLVSLLTLIVGLYGLITASSVHADAVLTPGTTPATTTTCPGYSASLADPTDALTVPYWFVTGPGGRVAQNENADGSAGATNGWSVSLTTAKVDGNTVYYLKVTPPAGIAVGSYSATYYYQSSYNAKLEADIFSGYGSPLVVPPTLPGSRPGAAYSYEASAAGVNLINGNKQTSVPIVGWKTLSGLPVGVTLTHNSQGSYNAELGNKWIQTYDAYIVLNSSTSATVHWGDETTYQDAILHGAWTSSVLGAPNPTPGHHDKMGPNASSGYDLITLDDQTTYHFAPPSGSPNSTTLYLGAIIDRYGYKVTVNRSNASAPLFVTSVADPTGRTITFTPTTSSPYLISKITDYIGRVWSLTYDSNNNLQKITLPVLNGTAYTQQFAYNPRYDITSSTDPLGIMSGPFAYDSGNNDQMVSATDAMGNSTSIAYNPASTVVTDPNGNATTYNFSESRLVSVLDPLYVAKNDPLYKESYAYDYDDNVTALADKRGHASTTTYDLNGKGTSTTDANGNVMSSTYDPVTGDTLTSTETPSSTALTTTNTWGTGGSNQYYAKHLVAVMTPLGTAASPQYSTNYDYFPYDSSSPTKYHDLPEDVIDPLGNKLGYKTATYSYTFNNDGSYSTTDTDANSDETTSNFGALGWLTSATDAASHTTTKIYDIWGRVIAVEAADGTFTRTWYDADGNVTIVSDPDATEGTLKSGVTWLNDSVFGGTDLSFNGTSGCVLLNNPLPATTATNPATNSAFPSTSGIGAYTGGGHGRRHRLGRPVRRDRSHHYRCVGEERLRWTIPARTTSWIRAPRPPRTSCALSTASTRSAATTARPLSERPPPCLQAITARGCSSRALTTGAEWSLYKNGTLVNQQSATLAAQNVNAPWAIGSDRHRHDALLQRRDHAGEALQPRAHGCAGEYPLRRERVPCQSGHRRHQRSGALLAAERGLRRGRWPSTRRTPLSTPTTTTTGSTAPPTVAGTSPSTPTTAPTRAATDARKKGCSRPPPTATGMSPSTATLSATSRSTRCTPTILPSAAPSILTTTSFPTRTPTATPPRPATT